MESGALYRDLGVPALSADDDRVMICGGPAMLRDLKTLCEQRGLHEGSSSRPGEFVIERAFVES
jgi:ferredoxin--NADP+ reductase